MDQYVATYKFKWTSSSEPGWLARWLGPGDWNGIYIKNSDSKARLVKRTDDGVVRRGKGRGKGVKEEKVSGRFF